MGLFSRDNRNDSGSDFLDEVDLPSSNDLNNDVFSNSAKPAGFAAEKSSVRDSSLRDTVARSSVRYGIEDAIKLMRSLPRDNNEIVVTVVKKTLESTQIQVGDIVADADAKEDRIRDQHKTLETEIKDLQEQIAKRNQQITELLKDLKETTDVRQRLQLAMDLDRKNNPVVEKPAPQAEQAHVANEQVAAETHAAKPAPNADQGNYGGSAAAARRAEQRGARPHN